MYDPDVPGANGSIGPFPSEYADPHVYARSVNSGAGNCVCGASPGDTIHTEIAPGVDVPPELAEMVAKSAEPQRFVLGIAYQAGRDPRIRRGVDGGRDYFTKAELEKACWSYMRSGGPQLNAFHVDGTEDCAEPVESFIWRWPDWDAGNGIVVKDGDWCLGAILSPGMWDLHKAGKVNGLSPEGVARRLRVAKEEAVPVAKSTPVADSEDGEMTELVDARFKKVALVGAGANGIPQFLISKQDGAAGLFDPDDVRDLIKQAAPQDTTEGPVPDSATREREQVVTPNGLTLTGSPVAIASFIHKAALAGREEALAEFHQQVIKAKYSADDKRKMLAAGHAIKNEAGDPAYPIGDKDDLGKAVHAVGRGGPDHDHIRAYVIRRAKALGASSEIPDNWNSDGSLKQPVSKEEEPPVATVAKDLMDAAGDATPLDDGIDGLDPTVPLATPDDEDVPGDPTDPGSPAWEAIDAATAQKWTAILARAGYAIGLLAEREMLEAASADPDDAENAWDLQDVGCAIDYAISVLAPFAVGEQSEADCGAMEMDAIGKAAGLLRPGDLKVIEGFAAVRKAGRVLSSTNEAAIRGAVDSLQKVLASLPEAPVAKSETKEAAPMPATQTADQGAAAPVAKEGTAPATPEEQAVNSGPVNAGGTTGMGQPRATGPDSALPGDGPQASRPGDVPGRTVVKGLAVLVYDRAGRPCVTGPDAIRTDIAKAGGDSGDGRPSMQAVFDSAGNLVGVVDPDAITPVAGTPTGPGGDAGPQAAAPAPAPDADASDDDMEPQPAADAGTPADAVGKSAISPKEATMEDVLKGIADAQAALAAQQAQYLEAVAKALTAGAEQQAEETRAIKARLANVEDQPAVPGVFSNGVAPPRDATPPAAPQLRGQNAAAPQVDVAKALARKQEFYQAPGARLQDQIAKGMQSDAISALAAVHAAGPHQL